MPYVLPTLPLSPTSFSSDHSYSNSLSPSPSTRHSAMSFLGMSSPSTAPASTVAPTAPSTTPRSHVHSPTLFDWPSSSAFSHSSHPPLPRSRSKARFEDPNQEVASPSASSSSPLNENPNHLPAPVKAGVELSSSSGVDSVTLRERSGIPVASDPKLSDSNWALNDGRSSLTVNDGATTANERIYIIEDSNLPSVGPGFNGNAGSIDKVPTGSFAQADKEGLKLRVDVRDLAARSFLSTTGCVMGEQVPSMTTTKKPATANMLSLKEMKEASMPRSSPPSNSNSALDPPHPLTKHGRSRSSHQLSQTSFSSSSIQQDYVYPPKTPQYIRKKSGELVKPSLKPCRSSMFASSTPHSDAAHKKGGGKAGSTPIGKLGGLRVSLNALPPVILGSQSEPTTPTGLSKSVHFDANLEHVKLFLAEQKPLAVSRDGTPTETSEGATEDYFSASASSNKGTRSSEEEREQRDAAVRKSLDILALNMPGESALKYLSEHSEDEHVKLESLSLSEDATCVKGLVLVRNLAFTKRVAARFTMDRWQTTSEVSAKHVTSVPGVVRTASPPPLPSSSSPPSALTTLEDGSPRRHGRRDEEDGLKEDLYAYDRFEFFIRLTDFMGKIWEKTLHICVRFAAEGYAEAWDNNGGQNYTVVFKRKMISQKRQLGKRVGSTVKWGVGAPDDDDDDDEEEEGVGMRMKVAALKKTLEKAIVSSEPSTGITGMGTPPKGEPMTSVAAESNQSNPLNRSGPTAFVNSLSAQDVLLRVGKPQYSPTQSPVPSPTSAKRTFFMPGGDVPLSPRHTHKEGSLAGRYDLGSSLKNAVAGGTSSLTQASLPITSGIPFPAIGSPLRSPVSPASTSGMPPRTLGSPFRSTSRGSPRDAGMLTQGREVFTESDELGRLRNVSPFRTSSDTDIPASLRRSGLSPTSFESSPVGDGYSKGKGKGKPVMPDPAESRDHQGSYSPPSGKDHDTSGPPPTVSMFLPVPEEESNMSYDLGLSTSPPFSDASWSSFGSMNDRKNVTSTISFPSIGSSTSVESSGSEGHPKKSCQGCMDDVFSSSSTGTSASNTSNSTALSTPVLSPTETIFAPKHDEPPSNTNEHNLDSILDQFCFYTGSNGVSGVHRSYSTSSVEEFFAHGGHAAPEIPLLDHSGHTTPTASSHHYNIPRSSRSHSPDAWNNALNTSPSPTPRSQRSPMRIQQPILG